MANDVFLVSAKEDAEPARLIVRRLRALKFKVWFDPNYADETFDAREAKAALESQSMLVLWSASSVKSDWVRAAASVGHSRQGMLVQAALDDTIPYDPFRTGKRYGVDGMTSRKTPEGFYQLVEELGRRDGRTDLREWMNFGPKDDEPREAWLAAHPADAMAREESKRKDRLANPKPAAAAGAASLMGASGALTPDDDADDQDTDDFGEGGRDYGDQSDGDLRRVGSYGRGSADAPAGTSSYMSPGNGNRPHGYTNLNPPGSRPAFSQHDSIAEESSAFGPVAWITGAIALMLLAAWNWKSETLAPATRAAAMPAIGNSVLNACPPGELPRYLLETREPGPIIDDTQ